MDAKDVVVPVPFFVLVPNVGPKGELWVALDSEGVAVAIILLVVSVTLLEVDMNLGLGEDMRVTLVDDDVGVGKMVGYTAIEVENIKH